jgi:hypothetical protein
MMMKFLTSALPALLILTPTAVAQAQDTSDGYSSPCAAAPFTDWDFWIGDWVAFDYTSGIVQGIDRVEKINDGCVILQDWSQMTDRYRAPNSPDRYSGISFSTIVATPSGPAWSQGWVGNSGGLITLTGGLDENGTMVIESAEFPAQDGQIAKRVWYWDPEDDGSVHSWGELYLRAPDGSFGDPQIPWNLRYVSRHVVEPLAVQDTD